MDLINRFTNDVLFSAEVETVKNLLLAAISAKADLRGANLRGADLREANLFDANLRGADLRGADLREANLFGANLFGADLFGANLFGANLFGANLREANLFGADLREANLRGANLFGADLFGAKAEINGHSVLQINGLAYPILITDTHLRAGCQNHTFAAWRTMTPSQIADMDGQKVLDFYPTLISIIDSLCKDREAVQGVENV